LQSFSETDDVKDKRGDEEKEYSSNGTADYSTDIQLLIISRLLCEV